MKKLFLFLFISALVFSSAFLITKTSQAREEACFYSCGEPNPCQGTVCGTQCCGSPLRTGSSEPVPHEQLSINSQILRDAEIKQDFVRVLESSNLPLPLKSGTQGSFVHTLLRIVDNFGFYGATLSPSDNIIGRNSIAAFNRFHDAFGVTSSEIAGQFSQADFNKLKGFIDLFSRAATKLPSGVTRVFFVGANNSVFGFNPMLGHFENIAIPNNPPSLHGGPSNERYWGCVIKFTAVSGNFYQSMWDCW